MEYDVFANWEINKFCNFRCEYCFNPDETKQNLEYKGHDIKKAIDGFNKVGPVFLIHISGGEPFLQPNFVELCDGLTKKHYISINTNLSTKNIYDFAEQIDSKRVAFVQCSLHIEERERKNLVKDFIDKYNYLKNAGFEVFTTQVLYPPVLERFEKYYELFRENGIVLGPRCFKGNYKYVNYPTAYTKKEKNKILRYIELSNSSETSRYASTEHIFEKEFVHGDLSFRGLPCKAGKDFVTINYNGEVIRCLGEPIKMGNIFNGEISFFKEPRPCPAKMCVCPAMGLLGAEGKHKFVKITIIKNKMKYILGNTVGTCKKALNPLIMDRTKIN